MRRLSPSFPLHQWLWLHLPKTHPWLLQISPLLLTLLSQGETLLHPWLWNLNPSQLPPPPTNAPHDQWYNPSPPWHNTTLSHASQPFQTYFNMLVTSKSPLTNNPSAQQHVDAYWDNLVDLLKALYKINDCIALWPFTKWLAWESDLLTNPSSLAYLTKQLTWKFHGLWIRNENSPFYVSILLGFSMAFEVYGKHVSYVHGLQCKLI